MFEAVMNVQTEIPNHRSSPTIEPDEIEEGDTEHASTERADIEQADRERVVSEPGDAELGDTETGETERGDTSQLVTFVKVDIRRGRIPADPIHQIPDHELVSVANGSPESWHFSLALALISLASGLVLSLVTTPTMPLAQKIFFIALASGAFWSGISLGIVWLGRRASTRSLVDKIRARLK